MPRPRSLRRMECDQQILNLEVLFVAHGRDMDRSGKVLASKGDVPFLELCLSDPDKL